MGKYSNIIILLIFIISFGFCQSSESDSLTVQKKTIGYDKIQHVVVSCALTLSGQYVFENKSDFNQNTALSYSASSTALVGLTKELNDTQMRQKPFDWGDMIANIVGIGIAVLIVTL